MGSMSLSLRTLISETPSVSRIHSWICLNSPSSVMVTLFLFSSFGKFMYTLDMASMPCRVMSVSMFASMHLKNTSSSILSSCSSSSWNLPSSLFIILIRSTSFSALSSLKMQFRSSPKPRLIFSDICSMVSFLSVMRLRSSSIRRSQGEMRVTSKSGIS